MTLLTSSALWFLLLIPGIILMYILKQKFREENVSSIYLWNAVLKDIEVNTPWQKLKKNLLLLLQILIILLLVFAAANPFIDYKAGGTNNFIVVIDNSGSMSALYEDNTRFEEAKERAMDLVKSAPNGSEFSIISMESEPNILITNSTNKSEIINKINSLTSTNSAADINESLSLVKSIGKQYENYKAVFYTDSEVELSDINGELVSLASKGDNVSLDYIASNNDSEFTNVLVRITNRGESDLEREICLYDNNEILLDIRDIDIQAGKTETIIFDVYNDVEGVYAEISEKDYLMEDNRIYHVIKQPEIKKALLVTEKNLFLEKAIVPIKNVELYKTSEVSNIDEDYDLYIFDGIVPGELPNMGSVFFINPNEDTELFNVGEEIEGGRVEVIEHQVTRYMKSSDFIVSKLKRIDTPYWGQEIFSVNNDIGGFTGEYKGRKIGVLAFDLHNSDFPLSAEFPIFINNIMNYFLGDFFIDKSAYFCDEEIRINPIGDINKIYISKPKGDTEFIDIEYPIKPFTDTTRTGIYKLVQENDEQSFESLFAINFPSDKESNINLEVESKSSNAEDTKSINKIGLSIQPILILLALFVLLGEWFYYVKS